MALEPHEQEESLAGCRLGTALVIACLGPTSITDQATLLAPYELGELTVALQYVSTLAAAMVRQVEKLDGPTAQRTIEVLQGRLLALNTGPGPATGPKPAGLGFAAPGQHDAGAK